MRCPGGQRFVAEARPHAQVKNQNRDNGREPARPAKIPDWSRAVGAGSCPEEKSSHPRWDHRRIPGERDRQKSGFRRFSRSAPGRWPANLFPEMDAPGRTNAQVEGLALSPAARYTDTEAMMLSRAAVCSLRCALQGRAASVRGARHAPLRFLANRTKGTSCHPG